MKTYIDIELGERLGVFDSPLWDYILRASRYGLWVCYYEEVPDVLRKVQQ